MSNNVKEDPFIGYMRTLRAVETDWFALSAMFEFYTQDGKFTGPFYRRRVQAIDDLIYLKGGGKAIDIGSSWGLMSINLSRKGYHVVALDTYPRLFSQLVLPQARFFGVEHQVSCIVSVCEGLPFEHECFDLAICGEIIEHLPKPERLIIEVARVLKPGAEVIISTPNAANIFRKVSHKFGFTVIKAHVHEFTLSELFSLVRRKEFNLEVKECRFLNPNIYPIGELFLWKFLGGFLKKIYYLIASPIERTPYLNSMVCDTIILRLRKR